MLKSVGKRITRKKGIVSKKKGSFLEGFEKGMEAITFAEAGEHTEARRIVKDYLEEQKKILVVEKGRFFSRSVMDYVIGLAERMGFEIIAVNIIPPNMDTNSEDLRKEFTKAYSQQLSYFSNKCKDLGIRFRHFIKVGDVKCCIKELERDIKRIEFLVYSNDNIVNSLKNGIIPLLCVSES